MWTPDQALLVLQGCRRICEGAAWPYQVSLHLAQTAGNGSRAGSRCRPAEAKLCQCDGKCSFCFQPKWFSSSSSSSSRGHWKESADQHLSGKCVPVR